MGDSQSNSLSSVDDYHAPFYASSTPLVYVVAAATLIAWVLLIILFLLPGAHSGLAKRKTGPSWLRSHGLFGPSTESNSLVPIGSRPWLQKAAAFSVTVALTTVTADTFKHAQAQYDAGYMNADCLRTDVTGALEIRVIRVISDLFLWLAQIQTLIRLFPRHKEKLIIKWFGFLLTFLDIIFSCLNSFLVQTTRKPRSYQDAIPALSYLFQLSLNLLYAAWVFYYVMTKRRYAFYHPAMPNITIVAFISMVSLLIPVVFFLVDITEPDIAAWGDYFRWVGAAAASIVVWEWVERIEALEKEEKKDGILGREIFDGENNLGPSSDATLSDRVKGSVSKASGTGRKPFAPALGRFGRLTRKLVRLRPLQTTKDPESTPSSETAEYESHQKEKDLTRQHDNLERKSSKNMEKFGAPPVTGSPVDRGQTESTGSTVYAVHYHPVVNTPPTLHGTTLVGSEDKSNPDSMNVSHSGPTSKPTELSEEERRGSSSFDRGHHRSSIWDVAARAFKESPKSPPAEVKKALSFSRSNHAIPDEYRARTSLFERLNGNKGASDDSATHQEPTVIPAPPRGQTWSPVQSRHSPLDPSIRARHRIVTDGLQQQQQGAYRQGSLPTVSEATPRAENPPRASCGSNYDHRRSNSREGRYNATEVEDATKDTEISDANAYSSSHQE